MNTTTSNIHNQLIITDDNYKGLPLSPDGSAYNAKYLDSTLNTIDGAMSESSRLIQCCFTLSFTATVTPMLDMHVHQSIGKFLAALQGWAIKVQAGQCQDINHKAKIDFIWQKDVLESGKPVYRVMLLLNPEAYYHQGQKSDESTLLYRIHTCWARIINRPQHMAEKLVRFSGNKITVTGNDADALMQVFSKASRLCVVPTGTFGRGCHGFGSSR